MATEVTIPQWANPSVAASSPLACQRRRTRPGRTVHIELETDKITSEATAEVAGIINILVEADEEVEIGQVVARIEPAAEGTAPHNRTLPQLQSLPQKPSQPGSASDRTGSGTHAGCGSSRYTWC